MTDSLQKYLAELFGTFTLVFIGTTAILATGGGGIGVKNLAIAAFRFGLALLAGSMHSPRCREGTSTWRSLAMVLDKRLSATDHPLLDRAVRRRRARLALRVDRVRPGRGCQQPSALGRDALFLEILATAIFLVVILQVRVRAARRHGAARDTADAFDRARRTDPVQRLIG